MPCFVPYEDNEALDTIIKQRDEAIRVACEVLTLLERGVFPKPIKLGDLWYVGETGKRIALSAETLAWWEKYQALLRVAPL